MSKVRDGRYKNNPYINSSGLEATKKKHTRWLKYQYCKSPDNYAKYKQARNLVTAELRRGKYLYEKDLASRIKDENKLFWGYVRSKCKTKSAINKLQNDEGNLTQSNHETANILNNFFASVFQKEGDGELPMFEKQNNNEPLEIITEELVSKAIDRLNSSKSQGPDNIHPKLLKETQSIIKKPLQIIFEKSLTEGKIPKIWKNANVTAIFKTEKKVKQKIIVL